MNQKHDNKHILVIDHQPYWRELSTHALKAAGFFVRTLDTYNYASLQHYVKGKTTDLIVLGCAHIGLEEQELITEVLKNRYHLLVLCTSLSSQVMRSLFLQGVDDVTGKPYDTASLIKIVDQVFESMTAGSYYHQ